MNRPGPPSRLARWRARAAAGTVTALVAAACAATTVPASAATTVPASAATTVPASAVAHRAAPDQVSQPGTATSGLPIPGLQTPSATITLLTGQQVTLTASGGGLYSLAAGGVPGGNGASGPVAFTASGAPGHTSVDALPSGVAWLIDDGLVDPNLFNLSLLSTRHYAAVPVIVQYRDAAAMSQASALPAARTTAPADVANAVGYNVSPSQAAAFWSALTRGTTPGGGLRLAGGATRMWLAGDQPPSPAVAPQPQDGQPLSTLTEIIEAPAAAQVQIAGGCNPDMRATILLCSGPPPLVGLAGAGEGERFTASNVSCATMSAALNACAAYQVSYSVPPGVYSNGAASFVDFSIDDQSQTALLDQPQFTVTGDTTIVLDLGQAQPVKVTLPRPAQTIDGTLWDLRTAADGKRFEGGVFFTLNQADEANLWVLPAAPVTVGTFHMTTLFSMDNPQVTMAVTAPGRVALDAWYPSVADSAFDPDLGSPRFTGQQELPLVDVGFGQAQDFSGKDVRGKLVLMRPTDGPPGDENPADGCTGANVETYQLENALQAGAAGVILDPTGTRTTAPYSGIDCTVPRPVPWNTGSQLVNIPFVWIPSAQASYLRTLLGRGPVQIMVTGSARVPYSYDLSFTQEGQIPADLHYTVTPRELATRQVSYDLPAPQQPPTEINQQVTTFRPDDVVTGVVDDLIPGPASRTVYFGPISPDTQWQRFGVAYLYNPDGTINQEYGGPTAEDLAVFSQPDTARWTVGPEPLAPGTFNPPLAQVTQAQPARNYITYCAGCRQGNTFYPELSKDNSGFDADVFGSGGLSGDDSTLVDLYQGSQEIASTPVYGNPTFTLASQPARYRLTIDSSSDYFNDTPGDNINTDTTWDFSSAAPATDQVPPDLECLGTFFETSTDPCAPQPLIFLRYNVFPSLFNSVTPGVRQMQVTAYYQALTHPSVTSLKLWTSTDGGTTWQPAKITRIADGTYTVSYTVPAASSTNGYVSIKAQASDAAGNDITQEIDNAYSISAATSASSGGR